MCLQTIDENNLEQLITTKNFSSQKRVIEKFQSLSCGLYWTKISAIEVHSTLNQKVTASNTFVLWHDRLGHPGSIMIRRIIENSNGNPLKNLKILLNNEFSCTSCYHGRLIIRPSPIKIGVESPAFLERIQGDICGHIHPSSGSFKYFMVLIDTFSRWSHVCLLSSRNLPWHLQN